jgi:RimJ/RimL family protein N-acetyltransferase
MTMLLELREVRPSDLDTFFVHQTDPVAAGLARFSSRDRKAFDEHWQLRVLNGTGSVTRAIVVDGVLTGHLGSWVMEGERWVGYWLGREFWGRGIGARALQAFVTLLPRPLLALVAHENRASIRVLEKAGFRRVKHEDEDLLYRLEGAPPRS